MKPRLRLNKERLSELTSDELAGVAGGAPQSLRLDCLTLLCQTQHCTTAMSCGGGCESHDVCN